jgi:single-strand DNA-binding protein
LLRRRRGELGGGVANGTERFRCVGRRPTGVSKVVARWRCGIEQGGGPMVAALPERVAHPTPRRPTARHSGAPKGMSMSSATTTTVVGNLTRDPEIRYTREGQATCTIGVAANRRWQNRETNEWEESTSFFDVVAWRDLAENVALSLTKGMRVIVTGRLEQRSWETEDGDKRFKIEIVADEVGPALRFATVDVHRVVRPVAEPDAGSFAEDGIGA